MPLYKGFLKEGDAAMIKLAALSKDGKDRVLIFRENDGETFEAQIEDGNSDISSSDSSSLARQSLVVDVVSLSSTTSTRVVTRHAKLNNRCNMTIENEAGLFFRTVWYHVFTKITSKWVKLRGRLEIITDNNL
jgi:hypothetical protein